MDFFTRCWSIALPALSVLGCQGPPQASLRIESVQLDRSSNPIQLIANQSWQMSDTMLDAMEHGVPLHFTVQLQRDQRIDRAHHQLRFAALAGTWEWHTGEMQTVRRFATRAQLEAALDHLEWLIEAEATPATQCSVQIAFEPARLPAPLRLPALLDARWQGLHDRRDFPCV